LLYVSENFVRSFSALALVKLRQQSTKKPSIFSAISSAAFISAALAITNKVLFPVAESNTFECIRPGTPLSLEDARRLAEGYVEHYNNVRLNSAIGYITPKDMLAGHQQEIQAERDRKLDAAKEQRKNRRQGAA
jgi:hypothetical protein